MHSTTEHSCLVLFGIDFLLQAQSVANYCVVAVVVVIAPVAVCIAMEGKDYQN